MSRFKLSFLIIIVFTSGLVFILSIYNIRKNMGPIEVLKDATKKISQGLFGHRIVIESNDEFEDLGNDFNNMSIKLKDTQELLVNTAKLTTMGQVTKGIIDEIKEPLSAISAHLQLSMRKTPGEDTTNSNLKTALESVSSLNALLNQFQSFATPTKITMNEVSLNRAVRHAHDLMKFEVLSRTVKYVLRLDDNLPPIYADLRRIQQVIANLMINSLQALEGKTGTAGRIIIETYSRNGTVFLSIKDNGCGIPEALHESVFDPFFTTKTSDKGTGLGLAIVQSIIHSHKGKIALKSKVGVGTQFIVAFPAYIKKEES